MKTKFLIAAATSAFLASASFASSSGSGNVSVLIPSASGVAFFNQSGTRTSRPSCSGDRWAIDLSTPSGAAIYSTILSAYALNKPIQVQGTSTCTVSTDTETVAWVVVP